MEKQPPISGRRVAGHRDRLGIKQKQLAELLGIGISTLQGIERNRANPGLFLLIDLCRILTENRLDLLTHGGLDDEGEYLSARFWKPENPLDDQEGPVERLRPEGLPITVSRRRDEVRPTVPALRRAVRTDQHRSSR